MEIQRKAEKRERKRKDSLPAVVQVQEFLYLKKKKEEKKGGLVAVGGFSS